MKEMDTALTLRDLTFSRGDDLSIQLRCFLGSDGKFQGGEPIFPWIQAQTQHLL